jgi:hypothetical protein
MVYSNGDDKGVIKVIMTVCQQIDDWQEHTETSRRRAPTGGR